MSGTVVLLLDEIHRLNKVKQDFLLPLLESGQVIMIGATTENPYLAISPAIRSRCQIFELKPLTEEEILTAVDRALTDEERGLGKYHAKLTKEAGEFLAQKGNGDLRATLNSLELAVLSTKEELEAEGKDASSLTVTLDDMADSLQMKIQNYDADGDGHYDLLSAFQKSIRGSDPDAASHYLARLLEVGQMQAACRRLMVIASEDVGLAYPQAVSIVKSCIDAANMLGLPEARIPLAEAVILMATAPKSNSAIMGIDAALSDIRKGNYGDIPAYLMDSHYTGAKKLGRGLTYQYPHSFPNHYVPQQYLPDRLKDAAYYQYGENKTEQAAKAYWARIKGKG